jgi:hypothetical protein
LPLDDPPGIDRREFDPWLTVEEEAVEEEEDAEVVELDTEHLEWE